MTAPLLTAKQVAERLGVSEWWVAEQARQKNVECIRLETRPNGRGPLRFTEAQVEQLIARMTVPAETAVPKVRPRRNRRTA